MIKKPLPRVEATKEGCCIVCTPDQKEVMDWAEAQQRRYGLSDAPAWANQPSINYSTAEKMYLQTRRHSKLNM